MYDNYMVFARGNIGADIFLAA